MHASREDYKRFHERRHRTLIQLLERHLPQKVERCLDIGGGGNIGGLADTIRERFAGEIHAVDREDDVDRGKAHGILAVECDIDKAPLPYEDAFFDLIIFASVIEHLYNPSFVLSEITRVLKPGGILVLEAPNAVSLGRRLDALLGRNPFRWFNQYNALEQKGFMEYCSVFYTAEEAETLLADRYDLLERRYAMHQPRQNPLKAFIRETAVAAFPRMSDCFFVVARKRAI